MNPVVSKILNHLESEWHVIRRAPLTLCLIAGIVCGTTWWLISTYYSAHYAGIIENNETSLRLERTRREVAEEQTQKVRESSQAIIERYKRILGLEKNSGTSTLIELTNEELRKKATLLVQNTRDLISSYEEQDRRLQDRYDKKEIDEKALGQQQNEILTQAGKEYHEKFYTDVLVTLMELRNRVPKEKRQQFIALPDLNPADSRDPTVSSYGGMSIPFSFLAAQMVIDEIEKLTMLLPDK